MVILQATLATIFLKIFGIFIRSEAFLLFAIFFLYGLNIMRISYFVASWPSSKFESVLVTQSIIILSLVPFWYICADGLSELYSAKIFSLFFPSSCFAFVLRTLLRFEIFGVGASFSLHRFCARTREKNKHRKSFERRNTQNSGSDCSSKTLYEKWKTFSLWGKSFFRNV
ncbi:hypothetical protein Anas_04873 [Armadillidium nasatum]|uniref:Transmembrane protein n=1 Tax=Armadillidium nasatum TaxID=96803 RepID=A0A5N5SLC3_9CRUS|nr:hypothetical protein Anas_04873 [Armadillidium nasatum]